MKAQVLAVACLILIGSVSPLAGAEDELPKINPDGFTASAVCGECHQAIHAVWRQSLHSNAWSNGVFQAGYQRATESYGAESARMCLSCHAPTTRHTKDFEAKEPITREGVTCDFCHSVKAVQLGDTSDPVRLDVGKLKYGPLRHAQSPVHEVVDSSLHRSSEFCAACHEYTNANGVKVLGTYGEWKASPYAKRGQQCQDCHMPLVPGRVVALGVKEKTSGSINLHDVSGSHDVDKVREAIELKLLGTDWMDDRVWVFLRVANNGSGHSFPTGLPMHRAVLEVVLRDRGTEIDRREISFEVVMLDEKGRPIEREHEVFLKAARIRSDTRLRPQEARELEVAFRKVSASKLSLSAALFYQY
ncbi:MAG: hypothetical protein GY778_25355 [bacterium]|nr:hypothetical protein [bacterium]